MFKTVMFNIVNNNITSAGPKNHTQSTYEKTPGFKPSTIIYLLNLTNLVYMQLPLHYKLIYY